MSTITRTWLDEPPFEVSVILPTRGRKEALKDSVMSLINLADNPEKVQILLGFDNDDRDSITWCTENLLPELSELGVLCSIFEFEPLGYIRLNEYVNGLAKFAGGRWMMFWNDDAVMQTSGWDSCIAKHDGKFRVLRMKTHNEHPYAIFPIVPREWYFLLGYLCPHQISDAWISQTAFILDIMITIDVNVLHDRHDLTGNNQDDTFKNRIMLEGNHHNPADFNHVDWRRRRFEDANKIAWFLKQRGEDTSWFEAVAMGKQDPWTRMLSKEYDPNNQCKIIPGTAGSIVNE